MTNLYMRIIKASSFKFTYPKHIVDTTPYYNYLPLKCPLRTRAVGAHLLDRCIFYSYEPWFLSKKIAHGERHMTHLNIVIQNSEVNKDNSWNYIYYSKKLWVHMRSKNDHIH